MFQPTQAPYIRPGVVIHEPDALVGNLLGKFALTLKERGFAVAGCVRQKHGLLDLSSGLEHFPLARNRLGIPMGREI